MGQSDLSDADRPPGGTSRLSGSRTPRKVQWLDVQELEGEARNSMLDEHGLDPEAFGELTEALERLRKGTPLKSIHYYPPQPSASSSTHPMDREGKGHGHFAPDTDQSDYAESVYPSSGASSRTFASHLSSPDFSRTPSPTHDVPGNYIEDTEDAGLPGTKDLRSFARKKAQNVIRPHIKRGSHILKFGHRGSGHRNDHSLQHPELQRRKPRRRHGSGIDGDMNEKDLESAAGSSSNRGRGILSTILNLYERPDTSRSETSSNRSYSDVDFTDTSRGWSSDEGDDQTLRRSKQPENEKPDDKQNKSRIPKAPVKLQSILEHVSRPPAARNAGGVVGSLIATTGNLTGFAAPVPSQLQPNVKRPGYRLSRYSLKSEPVTHPPPAMRRANSENFEINRPAASEPVTPLRMSPTPPEQYFRSGSITSLSGLLGGYASSLRSVGRRAGSSTPRTPPDFEGEHRPESQGSSPGKAKRYKRKKAEVYITRHVAQIIRREEFLMKLTRAMMMFGGPSHRLQSQIQSAARVLDIEISFMYLPDVVLLSFDDSCTGTSHIKFIRQTSALDLGKLTDAFALYWKVIHDELSVSDASIELDALMRHKPFYNWWQLVIIGGMCSASICTVSFSGSFIDALVSFPLGAMLVAIQLLSVRNVLYSYVFEVTVTTLFSFIAAAVASTHRLCYAAIASSSVVLILPGFLVLTGALELMSRNIVSGSVRLLFAVVYALFLGFGFAIGAEMFELMTSQKVFGAEDYTCSMSHTSEWYQRTPSKFWAFLTVPMFALFLSMRNQAPWKSKEMALLIAIASIGWVTNYFTGTKFVGQSDIIAAVGAFAVGLVANVYARVFSGNAFVVMITGILFQLPSGLGSGGLLSYASEQASGSTDSYISGFRTALKLVAVAIGLTIGLGLSLALTHPIQSRKREAGIFSL